MQFTDDEIETIKDIINEHESDCPSTDGDKVQELRYKLELEKRPTPEELAEQEKRRKEFAETPYGKLMMEMFARTSANIAEELIEREIDNEFLRGNQWTVGTQLRIKLPNNYIVCNKKLSLWQRLRKYLNG